MKEIVRKMHDIKFNVNSSEWDKIVFKVALDLGVALNSYLVQPYVTYSLFWIDERNAKELNDLYKDKFISGNFNHKILDKKIGEPLFDDDEIIELYSNYELQNYSDLKEIRDDLKFDLRKINQTIYTIIQFTVVRSSIKTEHTNGLYCPFNQSKYLAEFLLDWALKLMFKIDLKMHQYDFLYDSGIQLNGLREEGAEIQYKIVLVQKIMGQKKYNSEEHFDSYLKNLVFGNKLSHLPQPKEVADKFISRIENKSGKYKPEVIEEALKIVRSYIFENKLSSINRKVRTISKEVQKQDDSFRGTNLKTIDTWVKFYWNEYNLGD